MGSWCNVLVENQSFFFFFDKIDIIIFPSPYTRNFGKKTQFFHKPSSHIGCLWANHWIYKRESLSASRRSLVFFNSEIPKVIHAYLSINKSTERERHPHVPHYQSAILSIIATCIITVLGMRWSCAVHFCALNADPQTRSFSALFPYWGEIRRGVKRPWHRLVLPRLCPFLYKEEKIYTTGHKSGGI